MLLETAILAGLGGISLLGLKPTVDEIVGDHSIEGKIQLIFKRANVCIESASSSDRSRNKKLYPKLVKKTYDDTKSKNPVFHYKMPTGMTFGQVIERMANLNYGLKSEVIPKYIGETEVADFTLTVLAGKLLDYIAFEEIRDQILYEKINEEGLWIPIGVSRRGIEWVNLRDSNTPHVLIGGMTGQGKSTLLRLILWYLHYAYTPQELNFFMCDFKEGVEFNVFGRTHHMKAKVTKAKQAEDFFTILHNEVQRRYQIMSQAKCVSLEEFHEKFGDKIRLPYFIVPIDELACLEDKEFAGARAILKELAGVGRAGGIHILVSTQRPSAEIIDGTMKNNIPVTVGFRTKNAVSSRVLMGEKDDRCAYLDVKGRAYFQPTTHKEVLIQVPELKSKDCEELMKPYQVTVKKQVSVNGKSVQNQFAKSTK